MGDILKVGALVLGALAAAFGIVGFFGTQIDAVQHKLETRSVVGRHYEALEDKDFRAAYDYFHPALRKDGEMGVFGDWKKDKERYQVEAINVYHLEPANYTRW